MSAREPEQPSSGHVGDVVPRRPTVLAELGGPGRGLETEVSGELERGAHVSEHASNEPGESSPRPTRIGPYRVDGLLGRGGMGEVYRGWDPRLQRPVAIKRILGERARPAARARFWREARVLAALKHPGLVALHDIGEDQGALFIAMELVEGLPLSAAYGTCWPADAAVALVMAVARALGTAHAAGIVHRDVKPSNVLVEPSGMPRLIDFGLARRGDDEELTREGMIVGTWSAMAPEQIAGEPISPQTDVHALGVMLFGLLTGESPYARDSREATAAAIMAGAMPGVVTLRPDLPSDLAAVIQRSLARRPDARPSDASVLADELQQVATNNGWGSSHAVIAEGIVVSDKAPFSAGLVGSGIASASRVHRQRGRVAWAAALGLVAAGLTATLLVMTTTDEGADAATLRATPTRATTASQALDATRTLPRKIVALLPDGSGAASADLADVTLATTERMRQTLAFAPDALALVSWRELAARAPDGDPRHLWPDGLFGPAGALDGVDVAIIIGVDRIEHGLRLTASLFVPGHAGAVNAWTVDVPASAPLVGARTLATTLASELGVTIPEALLPTRGDVTQAVASTVRAELALHLDHGRAQHAYLEAARRADPGAPTLRLLLAEQALARGDVTAAQAELRALRDAGGESGSGAIDPRDTSYADTLLAQTDGRDAERRRLLEAHLARFPRDIDAHIDLLQLDFYAVGPGKLEVAARHADAILAMAPATPLVASKLVRAYAWIGESARARERLAAHGLTPTRPGMASVFGELAMYEGDYPRAIELFERSREGDGDLAFYAANMNIAAHILAGDCELATRLAQALIPKADPPSADWTYFLMFNAEVGAGELALAEQALEDWPATTHTSGATSYGRYRWYLQAITTPDRDLLIDDLLALDPEGNDPIISRLVMRYAREAQVVAERITTLRAGRRVAFASASSLASNQRLIDGLEARLAFLGGDSARALSMLAALAHGQGWQATNEGELFERARWMSAYAAMLDEVGRPEAAEEAWRETLALGYERLLAMDVSYEAGARLAPR